ncbi:NrsF family protein [Anaeromyxobacter dehalogenans]|uniref:DUF1109 domain-containing protein n=1 Tax=Anaeromyxobacter dehalogenans (strain 2CP-C) TaxID=290397 RepID=Q2IIN5_ANADE|nr:NrsF family protein [Anaeromyxobacter dehalogenans]ABC81519.1 hypothetical protein Adeh_1746 [Anaeromyxobacter dehalogenans 2CP-C]
MRPSFTPPETLKLQVLEAVRRRPVPPRDDRAPAMAGLAALALVAMAATVQWGPRLLGDAGGLGHAAGRPGAIGAAIAAGSVVLALAATWAVQSGRSMLAPPRALLLGIAVGVPLLAGAWLVLWHGTYDEPFTRTGWRCFALTALTAPWPFAALVRARRRVEPRHPAAVGAALGAVAGAWAAVMVELWCPLSVGSHVLVGHVLPLAALALAGAAIGARAFRLRRL